MLWQRVCSQSCISFRRLSVSGRWPRPHRAARTSIPLRSIRSARFLTRLGKTSPSVQCVGRGFRHMHFTATSPSSSAYLDSAPLHLDRGFRHICKKRGKVFWNASIPQTFPLFSLRCSMLNVKNRRPRSFYVCKNSDFKCAIRGSNPGHPD